MSEEVQESELTVEDILSEADEAPYHTILEIWREVLKPAIAEANKKITPQWAPTCWTRSTSRSATPIVRC
jgi:hypothetical protein